MNHCCYYFDDPWKLKALYVIIMSCSHFGGNMHSVVPWILKNGFLETGAISEVNTAQISTHNASESFGQFDKMVIVGLWVWIPLLSHIVLCSNAFAKLQNTRVEFRQPVLMGNSPTCLYVLALSVCWMVCHQSVSGGAWHEILWPQKSSSWEESWYEIYAGRLNRNIASMPKRGDDTNSLDW